MSCACTREHIYEHRPLLLSVRSRIPNCPCSKGFISFLLKKSAGRKKKKSPSFKTLLTSMFVCLHGHRNAHIKWLFAALQGLLVPSNVVEIVVKLRVWRGFTTFGFYCRADGLLLIITGYHVRLMSLLMFEDPILRTG